MQLGFIGLGVMGKPMVRNLLSAGHSVAVYDTSREAMASVSAEGAAARASAAQAAADADAVMLSLPNEKIVGAVLKEVFAGAAKGTCLIDFSSISPSAAQRFCADAAEAGMTYIDAPVSGGETGARAGTLTIMAGCGEGVFARIRPLLEAVGGKLFCLGRGGHGAAVKVVNNLLLGCNMAAVAEALSLGAKYGLSAQVMQDVIGVSSGRSYAFEAKMGPFIMQDRFDGGFAVDLQRKDLGLALDAARDVAQPLPLTAAAAQVYDTARAAGLGRKDISSLIQVWEKLAGIKLIEV